MIRLFFNTCKSFHSLKNIDELNLYELMCQHALSNLSPCPHCGAPASKLRSNGGYMRDFITYESDAPILHKIHVSCMECSSCGHSHALLPCVIIPNSSFSLKFILSLIHARMSRLFSSVEMLCEHFQIAVSTFYRLFKSFIMDSFLSYSLLSELDSFLKIFFLPYYRIQSFLSSFFDLSGRTYLQAARTVLPKLSSLPSDILKMVFDSSMHYD